MSDDDQNEALPTYEKAILQTVVYKRIREKVNIVLKDFELNTTQWMVLGILQNNEGGQKISTIAHMLQVEVPLITTLSQALLRQEYVTQTLDARDRRSKPLALTEKGIDLLARIEEKLVINLKPLEAGLSEEELATYFQTLRTIIANAERADS